VIRGNKTTVVERRGRLARVGDLIARFRRNRRGNVAIIAGMSALPMIAAVGCVVDYAMATSAKAKLQAGADSAVLAAVSSNSPLVATAENMSGNGNVTNGTTYLTNFFNANAPASPTATLQNVNVTKSGNTVTAALGFTAQVPTAFLGVIGFQNITVTGTSTASFTFATYIDFYLLLDNTPSMGLGATQTDINNLVTLTGCAFGCHDISGAEDYYTVARAHSVTLRIDVLAQATSDLMTMAANTQQLPNQYRMAIYTFGTWGSLSNPSDVAKQASNNYAPNLVYPTSGGGCPTPGTNLSTAGTQSAQIGLMTINHNNENSDRATNYDAMLPAINTCIAAPGNGQSPSTPQKVLFLVTDGLADEVDPGNCAAWPSGNLLSGSHRCIEPINSTLCSDIKSRGIRIALLYTTYLLPNSDAWSNSNVVPLLPSIAPAMQACASPGLYFEVSPTQGISQAMNALFQKVVSTAHISN
jgi:Flp pilus assembly protein TadG